MGMFDFLFGSDQAQQTTSQIKLPDYIDKASESLVATAGDVAKEGYIPYTGQRLAGLSQIEQDAITQAQAMKGIGGTQAGQAYTAATASGAPALSSVGSYMTDYNKNVADIAAREMRDQSAIQQQGIGAQAAQVGAFGGSRQAVLEAERQKNLTQGVGDLYTKAQADAYQTALSASQQDRQQQLQSALGMSTTAAQQQALGQSDIQQQMGIGGLGRQMDQQALDLGYNNFLAERDYPKSQLGFYSNILQGTPYSQSTVGSTYTPQPSFLNQAVGAGISGLGIAGNLGWSPFG
ncbi:MAG TPA: hypothetical protein VMV86_01410 [Methanosarcinales archaeon]|nr:hypothetical protein [Methanosarcinales archaeon]